MFGRKLLVGGALLALLMGLTACSDTPANEFEAGECTNDDLSGSIGEIETVDCDEEHTGEAYAQFDIDGDEFPGVDEVSTEAQERCFGDLFEDYVGTPYSESVFLAQFLAPSEDSWEQADDRTVICIINGRTDNEPLEGSAEGAEA